MHGVDIGGIAAQFFDGCLCLRCLACHVKGSLFLFRHQTGGGIEHVIRHVFLAQHLKRVEEAEARLIERDYVYCLVVTIYIYALRRRAALRQAGEMLHNGFEGRGVMHLLEIILERVADALFHRENHHGICGGHRVVEHAVVLLLGKAMAVKPLGIFFLKICKGHYGHGIDHQRLNPFDRGLQD